MKYGCPQLGGGGGGDGTWGHYTCRYVVYVSVCVHAYLFAYRMAVHIHVGLVGAV